MFYYPPGAITTLAGFANRHEPIILPQYEPEAVAGLYKYIKRFTCHPRAWTREEYVDSFKDDSGKHASYVNVLSKLNDKGYPTASVTPFTKLEKLSTSKYKAPRLIQARHPSFNIEYGKYIKPLEQFITKYHHRHYNFGKGSYDETARRIRFLSQRYAYYTEGDHSTFDSHVTVEMLRLCHTFYLSCYKHDPALVQLVRQTIRNNCKTRNGDRYTVYGTRMSGDVDTSLGNSLVNYAILKHLLDVLNIDGDVIVNGDDSIIFSAAPIPVNIATLYMRKFNMETKFKESVVSIHQVEFCKSKYIINSDGHPTMMMDPNRIINIFGMTHRDVPYQEYLCEVLLATASIHKANNIGLIISKAVELLRNDITIDIKYRNKLMSGNFKYLEYKMIRKVDRNRFNQRLEDNNLIPNIFEAWCDINEFANKFKYIVKKIRFLLRLPSYNLTKLNKQKILTHYLINHANRTLIIQDVNG